MKNLLPAFLLLFTAQITIGQQINEAFFQKTDQFMKAHVKNGLIDYMNLKGDAELGALIKSIEEADFSNLDIATKKAYLVNTYNLLVINEAVKEYPISSVQDITGFFDKRKVLIAGKQTTLTDFEKNELLDAFEDPRLHFVLVCGAIGCPPITDFAYTPSGIEGQLEAQTMLALNNPAFVQISTDDEVQLSQIFKWYSADFGKNKSAVLSYVNGYRTDKFETKTNYGFYPYDWTLNAASTASLQGAAAANATRYIVSSTIPKGQVELKIFNNLYSEVRGASQRSTFFTTFTSFLYGINRRVNLGFNASYRRVLNSGIPSSPFDVLTKPSSGQFRQGITALGPQIRWAPNPKWQNFSIQSRIVFPIGSNLSGGDGKQYIDWQGPSFFNQIFNDMAIGTRFSLFTELGIHWEDIGRLSKGRINQVSTPVTAILSYSPSSKAIIYALGGVSPFYRLPFDYFLQGGFGTKYQFTRNVELELLYTYFTNKSLLQNDGNAATYNIGFRFNI